MIAMLSVAVGLAIVAMVVLTALMGWGGPSRVSFSMTTL